jgi:hypothetical protein
VQPAERGHGEFDRGFHLILAGHVRLGELRFRAERLFGGRTRLSIDVEQDDVAAAARMVSAVARPRPDAPPVTMKVFPLICIKKA